MIKRITPMVIIAATLLAPPLWAADGTMKFSGKVKENACTLDAGSKNLTVNLGDISINPTNTYSGSMMYGNLIIKLTNCPASSSQAVMKFEGTAVDSMKYGYENAVFAFSNSGQPGAAQGVGFIISAQNDGFSNLIEVNGNSRPLDLITGAGTSNDLQFSVGYTALGANGNITTITPGLAQGNVQLTVLYP